MSVSETMEKAGQRSVRRNHPAAKRLRRLREEAGFATAKAAADFIPMKLASYHHYENGTRCITMRAAEVLGRAFKVAPSTILYGDRLKTTATVYIVGSVDRGGWVCPVCTQDVRPPDKGLTQHKGAYIPNQPDGSAGPSAFRRIADAHGKFLPCRDRHDVDLSLQFPTTEAPPMVLEEQARSLCALRVVTSDMVPMFLPGDVVYYWIGTVPWAQRDDHEAFDNEPCVVITGDGETTLGLVITEGDAVTVMGCGSVPARTLRNVFAVYPIIWTKHRQARHIG